MLPLSRHADSVDPVIFGIDWQLASEIATTVSTIAVALSAIVVVMQLRQAARERYFSVTAHLFEIWQSPEFQHDQLFLLHKLACPSWEEFCAEGRGERAERALHRVGGYYDRIGNLVRHGLIRKDDMLPTIGGYAVAVWHRIEPLVKELRLRENAVLFENYEALLPECRECYVPGIDGIGPAPVRGVTTGTDIATPFCPVPEAPPPRRAPVAGIPTIAAKQVEVLSPAPETRPALSSVNNVAALAQPIPNLTLPDSDGVGHHLNEFLARGPAVLVYARGAWCPFCLRQLKDYGEHYGDFKDEGVEVFAVSPESPRRSRRMRRQLKLPFPVLSDSKLQAARVFNLIGHEKPGEPTPATLILDAHRGVILSTLNDWAKCVVARDALAYMRAYQHADGPAVIPAPQVDRPKPGLLGVRGLMNMVAGLVVR